MHFQKIRSVNFNNCRIDSIKENTFVHCFKLETVIGLGESIKYIETHAFMSCWKLKTVEMTDTLKIDKEEFEYSSFARILNK